MRFYLTRFCFVIALLLVALSVPALASDSQYLDDSIASGGAVKLGVVFTSDTFDIPDELSDFVVNIVGSALASVSSVSLVQQNQLEQARNSLGFDKSAFADVHSVSEIGKAADVPLILITKINYDFKAAAAQEAKNAAMKKLPFGGGGKAKHVQPTFDVSLIDTASGKALFNNKADLDIFTEDMKQQLLSNLSSGGGLPLGVGSLNPSALTSMVGGLVPNISKAVTGATKLAATATQKSVEGTAGAVEDYVETAETIVEAITPTSRVVNAVSFENKSTDPAKVIAGYGYDASDVKTLVSKHKAAAKIKKNDKKLEAYSEIFDEYGEDYLAAYGAALAAFNMNDGATSLEWCNKSLAINKQYVPARRLKVKANKLAKSQ